MTVEQFQIVSGVLMITQNGDPVHLAVIQGAEGRHETPRPLLGGRFAYAMTGNTLHLLDATTGQRRIVAVPTGADGEPATPQFLLPARDGQSLVLIAKTAQALVVSRIEPAAALITHRRRIAGYVSGPDVQRPVEAPDGSWNIPLNRKTGDGFAKGIVRLGLVSGEISESFVSAASYGDGFRNVSPDGALCLRPDMTLLPMDFIGGGSRLFGSSVRTKVFGLTVQLWQTQPLGFLRRLTLGWFTAEELPNETHYGGARPVKHELGYRDPLFSVISATTQRLGLPYDAKPRQEDFPEPFASSEDEWGYLLRNWSHFAERTGRTIQWAPDSQSFWHTAHGLLGWTAIDGTASPRYLLERHGYSNGTWMPTTKSPSGVETLTGRRAIVRYENGFAQIEAAPASRPTPPVTIPASKDNWTALSSLAQTHLYKAAEKAKSEARTICIPLGGIDAPACAAAILALRDEIARDLHGHIVGNALNVVFVQKGEEMGELPFFAHVESLGPSMAPPLRALMETFLSTQGLDKYTYLFSSGENGEGILHGAAKAFARLDPDPIPFTMRYGRIMDPEHEYSFAGGVAPALFGNLGWTPATLDFAIWLMAKRYYNSINHDELWNTWGFGAAAESLYPEPKAFATKFFECLQQHYDEPPEPGNAFRIIFLDLLDREIKRKSPWTQAVFAGLRLMPRPG